MQTELLWIDVSKTAEPERQAKSKRLHIANVQRKKRELLDKNAPRYTDSGTQTEWIQPRIDNPTSTWNYQLQSGRALTGEQDPEPSQHPVSYSSGSALFPVNYSTLSTMQPSNPADYICSVPRFLSGYHDMGFYQAEAGNDPEFAQYLDENPISLHGYAFNFCQAVTAKVYPIQPREMSEWWWMQALQLIPFMPLALSIGAIYKAGICGNNTVERRRAFLDANKLRLMSVRALNKTLSDSQKAFEESNALLVSSFLAIEVLSGDIESSKVHFKGLLKLINLCGGMQKIYHPILSKIYLADVCYSIISAEPPRLELDPQWLSEIGPLGILDSLPEPKEYHDLGTGFSNIPLTCRIVEVIYTIRKIVIYGELSRRGILTAHPFDNSIVVMAENRLLNATYTESLTPTQECACLGTIMYSMACLRRFASFAHAKTPLSRLVSLLSTPEVMQELYSNSTGLLIWSLWAGYYVSNQGHPEHHQWYLEKIKDLLVNVGITAQENLKYILGKFFFLEQTCGSLGSIFTHCN